MYPTVVRRKSRLKICSVESISRKDTDVNWEIPTHYTSNPTSLINELRLGKI